MSPAHRLTLLCSVRLELALIVRLLREMAKMRMSNWMGNKEIEKLVNPEFRQVVVKSEKQSFLIFAFFAAVCTVGIFVVTMPDNR